MKLPFLLLFTLFLFIGCAKEPEDKALGMGELVISPNSQALQLNETFTFAADYKDARGSLLSNVIFQWESSNPTIATIDVNGEITALMAGQTLISAKTETENAGITQSNKAVLTVVSDISAVATVSIDAIEPNQLVGESITLSARAFLLDDTEISSPVIVWTSNNTDVATIDSDGQINFLSEGVVGLVATVDDVSSPELILQVREGENARTGQFQNAAHATSGGVTLQVNDAGELELIFSEDFRVDNGPGLEVFLSHSGTPDNTSVNLGALKATSGTQTYAIPSSVMIDDFAWVVIHCVPYNIVFGRSEL